MSAPLVGLETLRAWGFHYTGEGPVPVPTAETRSAFLQWWDVQHHHMEGVKAAEQVLHKLGWSKHP